MEVVGLNVAQVVLDSLPQEHLSAQLASTDSCQPPGACRVQPSTIPGKSKRA